MKDIADSPWIGQDRSSFAVRKWSQQSVLACLLPSGPGSKSKGKKDKKDKEKDKDTETTAGGGQVRSGLMSRL